MVNEVIANYLKEYGDKFKLDDLKKEIISKGYSELEFEESLEVFKKNDSKKAKAGATPLPTQKNIGEKKGFAWWKILLILFCILLVAFGVIVLLNYFDFALFGFNVFDYFK